MFTGFFVSIGSKSESKTEQDRIVLLGFTNWIRLSVRVRTFSMFCSFLNLQVEAFVDIDPKGVSS